MEIAGENTKPLKRLVTGKRTGNYFGISPVKRVFNLTKMQGKVKALHGKEIFWNSHDLVAKTPVAKGKNPC